MYIPSILSFGLFASATAAQFYYHDEDDANSKIKVEKKSKDDAMQDAADKAFELADKLERVTFLIRGMKTCLKWTKKGIKPIVLFIRSGAMTEDFGKWIKSPKAFEFYALVCGSIFMTYMNINPLSGNVLSQFGSVSWTLLGESKKITEAYYLVTSISDFAKNPTKNLLPIAFATAMIAIRHLTTAQNTPQEV